LFEDATSVPKLKLVDSRPFRSGVVLTRYRTTDDDRAIPTRLLSTG
jgi:hypothetical protein